GNHIRLAQQNCVPFAPLKKIAHDRQVGVVADVIISRHPGLHDEWDGGHPTTRHPQPQPKAHAPLKFRSALPLPAREIRVKIVEAVVIPFARYLVEAPGSLLNTWENDALAVIPRTLLRPDVPIAVFRILVFSRGFKPWVLVGCVVDDQIDDDPYATLSRLI